MKPVKTIIENEPIKVFGTWSVYAGGELRQENLGFVITPDRLIEKDWILNLIVLGENLNDFFPAYCLANELAGNSEIIIQTKF